jgi:hypothetical protein
MDQNNVSFKLGIPFYIGIASIATGLFSLSVYSVSSWFNTLAAILAFIAAGLILHLGWLIDMDMDNQDSDNGSGGGGRVLINPRS